MQPEVCGAVMSDSHPPSSSPCRVLLVDDSHLFRTALGRVLARDSSLQVVGEAGDGEAALRMVAQLVPDVVVMDLMMPRLNGSETARAILRDYSTSTSVLLLSALARQPGSPEHREAVAALPVGVFELYEKPTLVGAVAEASISALIRRIRSLHSQRLARQRKSSPLLRMPPLQASVIVLGASTGGLDALRQVLERLLPTAPAVVIAQHLVAESTSRFAAQLQSHLPVPVVAVATLQELRSGHVYVAAQHGHLQVGRDSVACVVAPPQQLAASADELFLSTARSHGASAVGLVLTGMGQDGARGLMALRQAGAWTIAQDDRSSLVYGMPRAAYEAGACCEVLSLNGMSERLSQLTAVGPLPTSGRGL